MTFDELAKRYERLAELARDVAETDRAEIEQRVRTKSGADMRARLFREADDALGLLEKLKK